MSYAMEHEKWLKGHLMKRNENRLEALKRGHGYGNQLFLEKIWWSLFGHFKGLHPEYEVLDWRGFPFYADFMWMIGSVRIVFEIQDFGSHVQNMERKGHRRELNRGLFMQSLQYMIVYISLDELKENPQLVLSHDTGYSLTLSRSNSWECFNIQQAGERIDASWRPTQSDPTPSRCGPMVGDNCKNRNQAYKTTRAKGEIQSTPFRNVRED